MAGVDSGPSEDEKPNQTNIQRIQKRMRGIPATYTKKQAKGRRLELRLTLGHVHWAFRISRAFFSTDLSIYVEKKTLWVCDSQSLTRPSSLEIGGLSKVTIGCYAITPPSLPMS